MSDELKLRAQDQDPNSRQTPLGLFNILDGEFHFEIDIAATKENSLRGVPPDNALAMDSWEEWKSIFCNPPYQPTSELTLWVARCSVESKLCKNKIVMLLPSTTGARWFQHLVLGKAELRFINDRVSFGGGRPKWASIVVVFGGEPPFIARHL